MVNAASATSSRPTSPMPSPRHSQRTQSAATPSTMKRLCDTVSAVLAITIDARLSEPATPHRRSRCAFTGSPPTAAVGVMLLIASPAMRTSTSDANGTRAAAAAGSVQRQPSASRQAISVHGRRTSGAVQPSSPMCSWIWSTSAW